MNRDKNIRLLSKVSVWDLIVIGGGASGLGAALDAASRGMKVLLIEKYDFSKGTSSKSTKLIHGGVRYLKNAEFYLVKEGSHVPQVDFPDSINQRALSFIEKKCSLKF